MLHTHGITWKAKPIEIIIDFNYVTLHNCCSHRWETWGRIDVNNIKKCFGMLYAIWIVYLLRSMSQCDSSQPPRHLAHVHSLRCYRNTTILIKITIMITLKYIIDFITDISRNIMYLKLLEREKANSCSYKGEATVEFA